MTRYVLTCTVLAIVGCSQGGPTSRRETTLATQSTVHPKVDYDFWAKVFPLEWFGDVGCMYFLIDENGNVTWTWDCY